MPRQFLPELQRDTFTYVGIRVSVRLAASAYRRAGSPAGTHYPTFVLNLAEKMRMLWPALYGPLVFVAKALAQGYTLREIRFMSVEPAPRTLHKRRPS